MGPRNLLILFFSTVAVSLVILIILFSLFFKNIDFNFNTKLPSSAPELNNNAFKNAPLPTSSTMSPDSKAEGISRSTINVPPEVREEPVAPSSGTRSASKGQSVDDNVPRPPVSDDSILNDDPPPSPPQQQGLPTLPPTPQKSSSSSSASQSSPPPPPSYNSSLRNTWGPGSGSRSSASQQGRQTAPVPPLREAEPAPSSGGPPVPGQ